MKFSLAKLARGRGACLLVTISVILLLSATMVWAFAEEPLHFRDPYSGETGDNWPEVSAIHDDFTYTLALAAGFSVTDSTTLQIWDQLVDPEQIGPGDAISYSNCTGRAFPPAPDPDAVCGFKPHSRQIWPLSDAMQDPPQTLYLPLFSLSAPITPTLTATQALVPEDWGEFVSALTPYTIYKADFTYAPSFLSTDIRTNDRESYENFALTIYRPHDGDAFLSDRPVVFFVHGGGWTNGYRDQYAFVAQSFTGVKGWVTVVIDYRLTSDQVFIADQYCPDVVTCNQPDSIDHRTKAAWYPDNIEDVAAALLWTLDHIAENGGAPGQIVVFGHSAGGHLASLLATHDDYASLRAKIRGVVSMSGIYDLNSVSRLFWTSIINQTFPGGFSNTELLDSASADIYLTRTLALPPFYLLYCQFDAPALASQAIAFDKSLTTLGFEHKLSYLPGYDHVSEMIAIVNAEAMPTSLIMTWIEELLKPRLYLPVVVLG